MKKIPVCFVAMAFGREDTDVFYEKLLLPTLKSNGVRPIIINRQQSNDDLNIQIFEQLNRADFCIADLTYTRPSVYFEAGYAQRSVPVIYTVRKDHLGKGQSDDLRVHFDLQMKPIVEWTSPTDPSFSGRLEKRLRATILKDWNKKQNEITKFEVSKAEFQELTQFDKLKLLRYRTLYAMRRIGIKMSQWRRVEYSFRVGWSYSKKSIVNGGVDHIFASTKSNNKTIEASIQAYPSLSKKALYDLVEAYYRGISYRESDEGISTDVVLSHIFVLSLKNVTAHQIESAMSNFIPLEKSKRYSNIFVEDGHIGRKKKKYTVITTFHFLTGLESEYHINRLLDDLMNNYIQPQTKTSNRKLKASSL